MRYEIFYPDDFERELEEEANQLRRVVKIFESMFRRRGTPLAVADNNYGVVMSLIPKSANEITIAHRLHDSHWQIPSYGIVTPEEARVVTRSDFESPLMEEILNRRERYSQRAVNDLTNAFRFYKYKVNISDDEDDLEY